MSPRPLKITLILSLLSTLHITAPSLCPAQVLAKAAIPESAVFLITSNQWRGCATAFRVADGRIVTNSHVLSALCPQRACDNIRLFQASGVGTKATRAVTVSNWSIDFESRALDFVILHPQGLDPSGQGSASLSWQSVAEPVLGQAVVALGFPHCAELEMTQGTVQQVFSTHFLSSNQTAHGSSGSPLLTADGRWLGILDESASLPAALGSLAFGTRFPSRSVRSSLIADIRNLTAREALQFEARALLNLYREQVVPAQGLKRALKSLAFLGTSEEFKKDAALRHPGEGFTWPLLLMGGYLDYLTRLPAGDGSEQAVLAALHAVSLAHNVELNGLQDAFFHPFSGDFLDSPAAVPARTISDLPEVREILHQAQLNQYWGVQRFGLRLALRGAAALIIAIVAWAFSISWVFFRTTGGLWRRSAVSAAVALLFWPLSLLIYQLWPRRSAIK